MGNIWESDENFYRNYSKFMINIKDFFINFAKFDIITNPAFLFYSLVLATVTILETSVTIRITKV